MRDEATQLARLTQPGRVLARHARGRRFKSCIGHFLMSKWKAWKTNRDNRRRLALEAFGNKCGCCGYNETSILQFHHLVARKGKPTTGYIIAHYSWKRVVTELRKCVLLCPNCHSEVHLGIRHILKSIQRFDESYKTYITNNGITIG